MPLSHLEKKGFKVEYLEMAKSKQSSNCNGISERRRIVSF